VIFYQASEKMSRDGRRKGAMEMVGALFKKG
jgi:hypothetical protein